MSENDPKTTDYCSVCNESPDSGSHLLGPLKHDYVFPTIDDICMCGKPRGAAVHGTDAPKWHAWMPPLYGAMSTKEALQHAFRGALEPQPIRVDAHGRVMTTPSLMRVMVEDRPGMPQFGVVLGMLLDERGDMQAVVRLDHYGMMLKAMHPSKVTPITPEQEENYKP